MRLAWAYARTLPLLEAIAKMRDGLVRFATAHGAAEKYHETITWAFVVLIHERIARAPDPARETWEAFARANPDLFATGAVSWLQGNFWSPAGGAEIGYSWLEGYNVLLRAE